MSEIALRVEGLRKHYTVQRHYFDTRRTTIRAVDGVSFDVRAGESFGLVGESGCGKSTVGRAILRLVEPDAGSVHLHGEEVTRADGARMRALRRKMQIVFQDPYATLNPRMTIGRALAEPMRVHRTIDRRDTRARVAAILEEVGLAADAAHKYPHEFSGGQRQRIGIARALVLEPEVLIADEPVSALDVSIQAQILALLARLTRRRGLSTLLISHDLGVVRFLCRRLAVMYLGRIVEIGPLPQILDDPLHPYTRALRDATPLPDVRARSQRPVLEGEVASAAEPPSGCHFHPRCPERRTICATRYPDPVAIGGGRIVACHLYTAAPPTPMRADP